MTLRVPPGLAPLERALRSEPPERGLVFAADPDAPADYEALEEELAECFRLTQAAVGAGEPVVYVVAQADLLGQRGALAAMRAGALLSAMRSLAVEGARDGLRANALAVGVDSDGAAVARWARLLLADAAVSGELVRVEAAHVGKVVP